MIIKGRDTNCAPHKTYEAQVDSLPSAFVDGTQGNGQERYVRIREKDPGRHVEIHIKYIATTIVIRRVGNYLTVAIRMPKEVVQQGMAEDGLDLCMKGCPAREQIDLVGFFREGDAEGSATAPGFTQKTAIANCLNHDLTDFHFDACVFDLMTTGDYTFGEAASKAAHDQKMLNREWMARQSNRTTLPTWVDSTSGGVEGSPGINSSYTLDGVAHGGVVGVAATTPVTLFLFVCCWIALVLGHPSRCCAAIVP